MQHGNEYDESAPQESARSKALRAFEFLSTPWIEDHLEGLRLLNEAKNSDSEAVNQLEKELEEKAKKEIF